MDVAEAVRVQEELRKRVVVGVPLESEPRYVAGVDVAYESEAVGSRVAGAVVVLRLEDLSLVDAVTFVGTAEFPYVPGLLAFREVPVILKALEKLTVPPDVLVCDGYGVAHPRRVGLASHLGVVAGIAAFGVAKTPFVGEAGEVGPGRGDRIDLIDAGEVVGYALRTQQGVKPVFVSAGHLIDLDTAAALTLRLAPRYRLPETTRQADRACREKLLAELRSVGD